MLFNKLLTNIQKYFIGATLYNRTMFFFLKPQVIKKEKNSAMDGISLSSQWSRLAPKRTIKNTDFYH